MPKIALIRHGHTKWNRAHRIQGRTDIPLDAEARTELAGCHLPDNWKQADLIASPMKRAMETGEILAGRVPHPMPDLIEMNWGTFEGQRGIDLKADPKSGFKDIEYWGWGYNPHKGETPGDVRQRITPWLNSIRQDTLAVCHIGIMRVVLAMATGWDFTGNPPMKIKRNRLYVFELEPKLHLALPEPVRLPLKSEI